MNTCRNLIERRWCAGEVARRERASVCVRERVCVCVSVCECVRACVCATA